MNTNVGYDNRTIYSFSEISWSGIAGGVLIGLGLHILLYGLAFCIGTGLFLVHGKILHILGLFLLWLTFVSLCLVFFISSFMAVYLGNAHCVNTSPRLLSFSYGFTTWLLIGVFNLLFLFYGGYPFSFVSSSLDHSRFYLKSAPMIFLHHVNILEEEQDKSDSVSSATTAGSVSASPKMGSVSAPPAAHSISVSPEAIKVNKLPRHTIRHLQAGAVVVLSCFLFFSLQAVISWIGAYYALCRICRKTYDEKKDL